ncbi:MAG: hypothetical protein HC828_05855 [Blastochloris sp.]|nr:hypothetical protein [Blastochloris sp.]
MSTVYTSLPPVRQVGLALMVLAAVVTTTVLLVSSIGLAILVGLVGLLLSLPFLFSRLVTRADRRVSGVRPTPDAVPRIFLMTNESGETQVAQVVSQDQENEYQFVMSSSGYHLVTQDGHEVYRLPSA